MKRFTPSLVVATLGLTLLTGCLNLQLGGGSRNERQPTLGEQLVDLQKARDSGAITDAEFRVQKSRLLQQHPHPPQPHPPQPPQPHPHH